MTDKQESQEAVKKVFDILGLDKAEERERLENLKKLCKAADERAADHNNYTGESRHNTKVR